jgi:O-antigen/teichoic acid export membrane protein
MTLVIAQTPTVALGLFAEPRAAGLFAFAWRLVEIVRSLIVRPIQGVAQSVIAAMRRQGAATGEFLLDLSNLAAWATFPAFVGLALITGPSIEVLLGQDWRAAAATLSILCIAGAISAVTAVQEAYLLAMNRIGAFVRASAFEVAIGLVIVSLASRYGPSAAAAAVVARALALLPFRTRAALAPEQIGLARLGNALASPLLAAVGMAVPVAVWRIAVLDRVPDAMFVISAIAIGVATVCTFLFGLMPSSLARLRTFLHASVDHPAADSSS